ncbi:hypothetical protein ACIA7S_28255 [Streptomyces sp. NPDC051643]|uniref:hypothetical protein n=1 Tax=Streptomyces sp. NPDC051643 TaxID=3365665 RepID=UPI003791A918
MASPLGTHIPVDCPVCADEVQLPVLKSRRDGLVITVTFDTEPLHDHIDTHEPTRETS